MRTIKKYGATPHLQLRYIYVPLKYNRDNIRKSKRLKMSMLRSHEGNARGDDSFTCPINVTVDGHVNEGLAITVDGQTVRMLDRDALTQPQTVEETILNIASDMVRNYASPYVLGESFSSTDSGTGYQSKRFKAIGTGGKSAAFLQPNVFPILQGQAATDPTDTKRRKTSNFVHRAISAPCAILIAPRSYGLNLIFYTQTLPRFAVIRHGLLIGATPIGSTLSRNVDKLEQNNKCAPVVLLNAFPHTEVQGITCPHGVLNGKGFQNPINTGNAGFTSKLSPPPPPKKIQHTIHDYQNLLFLC
jgi:hypothetical protein